VAEGESSMVGSTVTLLPLQSQPPNMSSSGVMVVGGMLDEVALTTEAAGLQALSLLAVDPSSSRTLLPPSGGVSRNLPPFLLKGTIGEEMEVKECVFTLALRPDGSCYKPHGARWRGCGRRLPARKDGSMSSSAFERGSTTSKARWYAFALAVMRRGIKRRTSVARGPGSKVSSEG
ncbi:hypothetical protein ACJX0J_026520, partial [Zea mays]